MFRRLPFCPQGTQASFKESTTSALIAAIGCRPAARAGGAASTPPLFPSAMAAGAEALCGASLGRPRAASSSAVMRAACSCSCQRNRDR